MANFRRGVLWATLGIIVLLMLFSIYGAFIGAERAQRFFNLAPLAAYWVGFILVTLVGFVVFPRLLRRPALLLTHGGIVLILLGGLWGSRAGHAFRSEHMDAGKVPSGQMIIYEGMAENRIISEGANIATAVDPNEGMVLYDMREGHQPTVIGPEDPRLHRLDFSIRLKDFRMEYYDPPRLVIESPGRENFLIQPVIADQTYELADGDTITILGVYRNLKIGMEQGQAMAFEGEGPGTNPAVRVQINAADGTERKQFVFASFPGFMPQQGKYQISYQTEGMVKDYFSDLEVLKDGKIVAEKTIQVNDPLHYGGYHFYQHSYDARGGQYTVLSVTSDDGLYVVFAGYGAMTLGIVSQMWLVPVLRRRKHSQTHAQQEGGHGA